MLLDWNLLLQTYVYLLTLRVRVRLVLSSADRAPEDEPLLQKLVHILNFDKRGD
jgi:hypothetical protein